jgi:hypothetical protein
MSVCLADLFSSWYKHIRRRSSSVKVLRGVGADGAGVECKGRIGTGWGIDKVGVGAGDSEVSGKGDWVVNILGQG